MRHVSTACHTHSAKRLHYLHILPLCFLLAISTLLLFFLFVGLLFFDFLFFLLLTFTLLLVECGVAIDAVVVVLRLLLGKQILAILALACLKLLSLLLLTTPSLQLIRMRIQFAIGYSRILDF